MKLTLRETLWNTGLKALLICFALLNIIIFLFSFSEINALYSRLTKAAAIAHKTAHDMIGRDQAKLRVYAQAVVPKLETLLNPQIQIQFSQQGLVKQTCNILKSNNTIDAAAISDKSGNIAGSYNLDGYSFIAPPAPLRQGESKFGSFGKQIVHVTRLRAEGEIYLTLFKKIDDPILNQFIKFGKFHQQVSKLKLRFYFILVCLFLSVIMIFWLLGFYIMKRLANKLMMNLQKLIDITSQKEVICINNNEIKEFHEISCILAEALNNLHQKNIFIEKVLDNITSGIILLDHNFQIILANKKVYQLLEIESDFDCNITDVFPKLVEIIKNASIPIITNIDYKSHRFLLNVSRLEDKILIAIDDISYKVSVQKQIAWRDVARVIAHEVKNPLTPTRLCAEQLLYNQSLSLERKKRYLHTIIENVEHVNKLINDFTSFTQQAQQELDIISFPLIELIVEILDSHRLAYKNVDFELVNKEEIYIRADRPQIKQALVNLLQNAAQACADIKDGHVIIDCQVISNECIINIQDNGIGIKKGSEEKLFQPYMTTKQYGTGLGLVIVRKIAQSHGGDVKLVHCERGAKTIFRLSV